MRNFVIAVLLGCLTGSVRAEEPEQKITFDDHIKPIFREHCTVCHSQSDQSGGLALDSYAETLAGGSSGDVVASGNADGSRLFALISHQQQPHMPPDEDPIAQEKQALIKTWILQGMPENSGSKIKRSSSAASAMLGSVTTGQPEGPPPMPERLLRQPIVETPRSAAVAAMAASPWAPLIAVGGQEQVVLYHAETAELLGIVPFPEGEPQSLQFTRDGKQLLIGGGRHSHSGCAVLVDVASGQRITKVGDEIDIVLAADISPNKQRIALAGPQKMVRVFDSLSGELLLELKKHTDWVYALRFSPDGILLASGDRSNGLVLWESDSGTLYADLTGHKDAVTKVDFRADSNVLASASLDGTIKLWDMFESKEVKSWAAHAGGTNDLQFTHDGLIVSAGVDSKIKLWNAAGELQREFDGLADSALRVAMAASAGVVAGGDWHGKVQTWRSDNPEQSHRIASNPPSIEKRLEQAGRQLAELAQSLAQLSEQSLSATQNSEQAALELAEKQQLAQAMEVQLAQAQEKEQALQASISQFDDKIAALEQELAQLKTQRETAATELKTTVTAVESLTTGLQAAHESAKTAQTQAEQLHETAQQARQKLAEVEAQRDAAQAAVDQALADKAAMEQRALELVAESDKLAAAAQALAEQLQAAKANESAESSSMEKVSTELSALREQLAALQKRLDEVGSLQAQAQQRWEAAKAASQALQDQARSAEQSAIEAQERLKLFQQSYGSID